ncbi:MAG: serine hydrolase domain-containing protein, partial [Thermoanaerobaculia bacterium]
YQSGSLGKMFTAAGVLLLAEDGLLAIDDPLTRHFPQAPRSWRKITIRHLLQHTSGLADYTETGLDLRRDYAEEDLLKLAYRLPLEFTPGRQWRYSNTGYMLLGILIGKLTGAHWSDFLGERIFDPLGMASTRVISEADIVAHRAAGYVLDETGAVKNQEWVAPSLNTLADGALYFTVLDLCRWDAALGDERLLSRASLEAWWAPARLSDGTTYPYGFGWALDEQRGSPVLRHGGSWQGFRAHLARFPDQGLTVVVLANLAEADPAPVVEEVAGLLDPTLRLPDPEPSQPEPDP